MDNPIYHEEKNNISNVVCLNVYLNIESTCIKKNQKCFLQVSGDKITKRKVKISINTQCTARCLRIQLTLQIQHADEIFETFVPYHFCGTTYCGSIAWCSHQRTRK